MTNLWNPMNNLDWVAYERVLCNRILQAIVAESEVLTANRGKPNLEIISSAGIKIGEAFLVEQNEVFGEVGGNLVRAAARTADLIATERGTVATTMAAFVLGAVRFRPQMI